MANTGAPHSLPYPVAGDPPAGHTQMQALAEQAAARLGFVGKSIVATSQTYTSSSYGLLTTPDRVQNVVVPTDGIIQVRYSAQWSTAAAATCNAAIFIGSTQAAAPRRNATADPSAAMINNFGLDQWLSTYQWGLVSDNAGGGSSVPAAPVTTGQIISVNDRVAGGGGACDIFVDAGTYDVSVQFKTTASTLTVKNRRLWVRVLPF